MNNYHIIRQVLTRMLVDQPERLTRLIDTLMSSFA
jgi:hypothetical protein